MKVLPPVLPPLPAAELRALQLDGDVVGLGDGFVPLDAIEDAALRARAVLVGRSPRLIVELGTAAWVWAAVPGVPGTREFCVHPGSRARHDPDPAVAVREVLLDPDDVVDLGGARVTSRLRTAVDLTRFRDRFGPGDVAIVAALARDGAFGIDAALTLLDRRRNLPGKRRAAARLERALSPR